MERISGKVIIYDGNFFRSEEEFINYQREERLNYILNDTELDYEKHTITIIIYQNMTTQTIYT